MKTMIIALVMAFTSLQVFAQYAEVTYNHESDIMNQFLTMETGGGKLEPAWYYNTFHKDYQATANFRNKLKYRLDMNSMLDDEKGYSVKVDSNYMSRAKTEALNIESRLKATDVTWAIEKNKINNKLSIFQDNINKIMPSGGKTEDLENWKEIYNCAETAIKYIKGSYLDMGQRKKEFLSIYSFITERNSQLVRQLKSWQHTKEAKEFLSSTGKIEKFTSNKTVAQGVLNRWQKKWKGNSLNFRKENKN